MLKTDPGISIERVRKLLNEIVEEQKKKIWPRNSALCDVTHRIHCRAVDRGLSIALINNL